MQFEGKQFLAVCMTVCILVTYTVCFAITPLSDRVAIEAKVRAEVGKDLAIPYNPTEGLEERQCLDGRPVKDFPGDIIEYWVNLECSYTHFYYCPHKSII